MPGDVAPCWQGGDYSDMHSLGRLIDERMKHPDHKWSLDDVVKRAADRGERLGRSNLDKLRKEPPKSISRATILGLAAGLNVTPLTVATAALESMGIVTRPAEVTDSVTTIGIDPTLGDAQRRQLVALIREMRESSEIISGVAFTDRGEAIPVVGRRPTFVTGERSVHPTKNAVADAQHLTRNDAPPTYDEPLAARPTPPGYQPGRGEQGRADGEESQDG